jgi:hypothetical protein
MRSLPSAFLGLNDKRLARPSNAMMAARLPPSRSRAQSSPITAAGQCLSQALSAYTAYTAYTAYVDLGMPMRWPRNRKTGSQRVLHQFVAFPPTSNSHFPYFHGTLSDRPPNSRGQANPQSQLIVVSPCLRG